VVLPDSRIAGFQDCRIGACVGQRVVTGFVVASDFFTGFQQLS